MKWTGTEFEWILLSASVESVDCCLHVIIKIRLVKTNR